MSSSSIVNVYITFYALSAIFAGAYLVPFQTSGKDSGNILLDYSQIPLQGGFGKVLISIGIPLVEILVILFWKLWIFSAERENITKFYKACVKEHKMSQEDTAMLIRYGSKFHRENDLIESKDEAFSLPTVIALRIPLAISCLINLIAIAYFVAIGASNSHMGLIMFAPFAGVLVTRAFAFFTLIELWGSIDILHVEAFWPDDCYDSPRPQKKGKIKPKQSFKTEYCVVTVFIVGTVLCLALWITLTPPVDGRNDVMTGDRINAELATGKGNAHSVGITSDEHPSTLPDATSSLHQAKPDFMIYWKAWGEPVLCLCVVGGILVYQAFSSPNSISSVKQTFELASKYIVSSNL